MNRPTKIEDGQILPANWFRPEIVNPVVHPLQGKRAAIYARYSYLGKRESSIERQVEVCTEYAEANGYVVVATYADRSRTGTNISGREDLLRMLEDAGSGMFDLLVVEDVDRLGRALEVTVEIWADLKRLKIEIHDTESGRLTTAQIGSKAGTTDEERAKIVHRNRAGKRRKAKEGEWVGAVCFGYMRVLDNEKSSKSKIVIKPDEAAIVREIFELYDEGVSPDRIAEILNLRPAEQRGNRSWLGEDMRGAAKFGSGILRRLRYAGYSVVGRNTVTKDQNGHHTVTANPRVKWAVGKLDPSLVIIEHELFDRVQARLAREKKEHRDPMWTVNHYALRGLFRCASCGAGMTPTMKRQDARPRITCNMARNRKSVRPGKKGCDNTRSTPAEQVDEMVREVICSEVAQPLAFERFVDEYNATRDALRETEDTERPMLERQLADLHAEQEDLWKNRASVVFSEDFIAEKRTMLRDKEAAAKARLEILKAAPRGNLHLNRSATGTLARELESIFNPQFDAKCATGARVVGALRKLLQKVVVDITDDKVSVVVHCRVSAVVNDCECAQVLLFERSDSRMGTKWESSKTEVRRIEGLVAAGTHALSDAEWQRIGPLLPDFVGHSRRGGRPQDSRQVINAALLHLNEGVPLARMPAVFGDQNEMLAALRRLSWSGGWDLVVDILRDIAPHRIPRKSSAMFGTVGGRCSSSLVGPPAIRARHGVEVAAGKFALSDDEWNLVADLVPEQLLMANKEPARISPRDFIHGVMYLLKTDIPVSHLPLRFGSQRYFLSCMKRFGTHGYWHSLIERLAKHSPETLARANLSRFDRYFRPFRGSPRWCGVLPKAADLVGIPDHAPCELEWNLIKHLFPLDLMYVGKKLAVDSSRLLAHALLYRVKEKIPVTAFPEYFGDSELLKLTITKFVFHHLWEEMVGVLQQRSPATLDGADLNIFAKFKRGRTRRYAHLLPAVEPEVPAHLPSDEQWAVVEDLVRPELLVVRGKPMLMEPRMFLHAIIYMCAERTTFGGLPKDYFRCSSSDIQFAMRKLVRHHFWDQMVARFQAFAPEWAATLDLQLFDNFVRSANANPVFRKHRIRKVRRVAEANQPASCGTLGTVVSI